MNMSEFSRLMRSASGAGRFLRALWRLASLPELQAAPDPDAPQGGWYGWVEWADPIYPPPPPGGDGALIVP